MNVVISKPVASSSFQRPPSNFVPQEYSQEIAADGWYKSASISVPIPIEDAAFWLNYGLGCDVKSYGDGTEKIWAGFVNELSVGFGVATFSRGPLIDIANRVTVKYTDFTVNEAARTTAQNDTYSQSLYGIWHKIVPAGTISSTSAEKIRDTYLQENKRPTTNIPLSSSGTDLVLTLNCLGYTDWLTYPYNEPTDTTTTQWEKIIAVLAQDPNDIISTSTNMIEVNELSVNTLDNDDRIAIEIIKELVSLGGEDDNFRRCYGVTDDRQFYVMPISGTAEYTVKASETGMQIRNAGTGAVVEPWNIRPNRWIKILDYPIIRTEPFDTVDLMYGVYGIGVNDLRKDPSMVFIESVTFTAPYDFTINGGKSNTITQQLAKLSFNQ